MEEEEPFLAPPLLSHHLSTCLPETQDPFFHAATASSSSSSPPSPRRKIPSLHRARTAPAMTILSHLQPPHPPDPEMPMPNSSSILRNSAALLLLYLLLGVLVYSTNPTGYSGIETHPFIDALYFCIVTLCTIGYGDIHPLTPATKAFACLFVLVGFGLIDVLLSAALNHLLDLQEAHLLARPTAPNALFFDPQKRRMRIRLKVSLAVGVVVLCIGVGAVALSSVEGLDWMDAVYLSVMSVTTVGYGDRAFRTLKGRVFASFWLLVSTLAVARAFLYLVEARIDKRHRRMAKWVLHRDLTVEDLIAADLNHNGFISKSEFVIYKLKEMGKIGEKDILQICNQFNKLDPNNTGKITLPDLLNSTR